MSNHRHVDKGIAFLATSTKKYVYYHKRTSL